MKRIIIISSLLLVALGSCKHRNKEASDELRKQAETALKDNKLDEAEKLLEQAIDKDDENCVAYNDMAAVKRQQKAAEDVVAGYFRKSIALCPDNASAINNIADYFIEQKQFDSCIKYATMLIRLDSVHGAPAGIMTHMYGIRGEANKELGNYLDATADLHKSLEIDSTNIASEKELGSTYWHLKRYENSVLHYTLAIGMDPTYHQAYSGRGNSFALLNAYDQALSDYNRAISLDSTVGTYYLNRAILYTNMGRDTAAAKDLVRAASLGDEVAKEMIKKLVK